MARRMASGRANVNDILASFPPVRDIGEGQRDPHLERLHGEPEFERLVANIERKDSA